MFIGNSMTVLSEYWQSIEKNLAKSSTPNRKISSDYLYLKTSCLTFAASLTKPIELTKLGMYQMFRGTRKKLEPFGQVSKIHSDARFKSTFKQVLHR